jgi:hypothetical protein
MTEQHPVTPPPGLIDEWIEKFKGDHPIHVAIQAARWGADQELEACVEWAVQNGYNTIPPRLRAARRPKPPSLKEQALESLHHLEAGCEPNIDLLRRALEALPND